MRNLFYILIISSFTIFYSCNKDEDKGISTVNLDFEFDYSEESFEANTVYDYSLGYKLKFERFRLYIANVQFVDSDGNTQDGPEIIYVDEFSTDNRVSFEIPGGDYSKIKFAIGVPQNLNGTDNPGFDAALFSADHPLSLDNGMYWTWNTGYRFNLIDGRVNTDPNIDESFETLLSIHTGKDYSYRLTTLNHSFNAPKDAKVDVTLRFDVSAFLENPDDVIDLAIDNQTHGENAELSNRVADNGIKSVEVE